MPDLGLDIARHRQVEDEHHLVAARRQRALDRALAENRQRAGGRRHHDVGARQVRGNFPERHRFAADAARHGARFGERTVGDEQFGDAGLAQVAGNQFDGLAGANQQRGLLAQPRENPLRQAHPGARHGQRIDADGGVRAHLLGDRKSVLKQPVKHLAGGPRGGRGVERGFHLAKNLRLADDHGIEPGSDPESVLDRLFVVQGVSFGVDNVEAEMGAPTEPVAHPLVAVAKIRAVVIRAAINFGAVAGGQNRRLIGRAGRQLAQRRPQRLRAKRRPLAQRHAGGLVIQTKCKKIHQRQIRQTSRAIINK